MFACFVAFQTQIDVNRHWTTHVYPRKVEKRPLKSLGKQVHEFALHLLHWNGVKSGSWELIQQFNMFRQFPESLQPFRLAWTTNGLHGEDRQSQCWLYRAKWDLTGSSDHLTLFAGQAAVLLQAIGRVALWSYKSHVHSTALPACRIALIVQKNFLNTNASFVGSWINVIPFSFVS